MTTKSKVKVKRSPKKALERLEQLNKAFTGPDSVKVGLPKGSNAYPDGTSVIMVGAVHEFGSPARDVPERSYLRSTVKEKKKPYKTLFRKLSKSIVDGKITMQKALAIIGLTVQTDVQKKITDIDTPALKNRVGNPLVDSGHLRQSIIFKVGE